MEHLRCAWFALSLLSIASAGCCCVQGVPSHGNCGMGSTCSAGGCGGGGSGLTPLASLASCRGGCGEVYVDEWISEPPTVDNCGYSCGGCGQCNQCQPIRSILKLLWGTPYVANCSSGTCDTGCDSGCSTCGSGHVSHSPMMGDSIMSAPMMSTPQPIPQSSPSTPMQVAPEVVPTPAPAIAPSSAKRLNPAAQRQAVRRASGTR